VVKEKKAWSWGGKGAPNPTLQNEKKQRSIYHEETPKGNSGSRTLDKNAPNPTKEKRGEKGKAVLPEGRGQIMNPRSKYVALPLYLTTRRVAHVESKSM